MTAATTNADLSGWIGKTETVNDTVTVLPVWITVGPYTLRIAVGATSLTVTVVLPLP